MHLDMHSQMDSVDGYMHTAFRYLHTCTYLPLSPMSACPSNHLQMPHTAPQPSTPNPLAHANMERRVTQRRACTLHIYPSIYLALMPALPATTGSSPAHGPAPAALLSFLFALRSRGNIPLLVYSTASTNRSLGAARGDPLALGRSCRPEASGWLCI